MLFSKLKEFTRLSKPDVPVIDFSALQNNLSNGLFGVMEQAFEARSADEKNTDFTEDQIEEIVNGYVKKNMIAAAASSIVPGPLGILGSLPELLLNLGNQMYMIYDMSCAFDKESFVSKDVLLDIPFAAFGGNTNLANMQNSACDLMDSPQTVLIEKATALGKNMIERTLKKSIVQFVPVAGPVMMGVWARMTTGKVAKSSSSFFDAKDVYVEHFKPEETPEITSDLQVQKIKAMANLIESNDEINTDQIAFISPIIENAPIDIELKKHLLEESLKTGSNFDLKFKLLKEFEEDEALISELVIMAKRSGSIDKYETGYIHNVAKRLDIQADFVDKLIAI